jgi:hypothetical protein
MPNNERFWGLMLAALCASGCGADKGSDPYAMAAMAGTAPQGGGGAGGAAGQPVAGAGDNSGGAGGIGGASASGGSGGGMPIGGAGGGSGGSGGAGGTESGGSGGTGGSDEPEEPPPYDLDCGDDAIVLEGHGPPENRINYIIVGDGYDEADLETTYVEHLEEMLRPRFTAEFEPYLRYRRFVNICALKVPSNQSGINETAGDTAFDGYGNDESRLGYINDDKVFAAIDERLPAEIEVDWTAVVLNGDRWWNSGGRIMVWSGAHQDAALAAEHEGGHSFQRLADEYGGNCTFSGNENDMRINVTMDAENTAGKWSMWLDFDHNPGTGVQSTYEGAQYCDQGAYRPSEESVMNMLWDSPYYNAISREQGVRIFYEKVDPIDASTPSNVTAPQVLNVQVIDPEVIKLEWSVDGEVVAGATSADFDVAAQNLPAGSHTISARAYDDTDWVRGDRQELEQTVEWTITVP